MERTLERTSKFRLAGTALIPKTCRCQKSKCLKNYCDCFAAAQSCTENCCCVFCENKCVPNSLARTPMTPTNQPRTPMSEATEVTAMLGSFSPFEKFIDESHQVVEISLPDMVTSDMSTNTTPISTLLNCEYDFMTQFDS